MPSLNLRNVLRRNPDRPSLRERAATLKAAAAKAIHRPKPAAVASPAEEAGTILDSILLSRSQELVAIEALQEAALKVASFADAHDCPDWVEMERGRKTFLAQVIGARAHTMAGVKAKAAVLDLESVKHSRSAFDGLSRSIAADVAALGILPRPEQTAGHVDPHVTLLPALRQAFAWTREAYPFGDEPSNSAGGRAHTAVLHHCWSAADRITDLPPPTTLAGLGALALALSVYAEEIIGRPQNDGMDDQRYPEERRLVAAIHAMMSVAGCEPLPGWVGFEVGPESDAQWQVVKAKAGEGSLPAWALAGKSGPGEEQGLAQACIDMAERLDWLDQNENVSGFSEEAWDAEFNRQGAVFRRAIDEPSADASDLAAKARLALSDLDRFGPADRFQGDGDRLMRVVLRETMALGGKSGSSDEGTPEIARIIEGPAASLPILDLSSCSIPQIARLYEVLHATYDHLSALGNLPCFWEGNDNSPAGEIIEREADRISWLVQLCAEEIARRTPLSKHERDDALSTRLAREIACEGRIRDAALMRDITTAWRA